MICVIFVSLINFVGSEWVELVPIHNGKNFTDSTTHLYQTTPTTYEVMMKTSNSENPVITTPVYETRQKPILIENEFELNEEVNVYDNQTMSEDEDIDDEMNDNVPYSGFFEFLQVVQKNLLKSASHESKMVILTNLRDKLLSNLYTRISTLWKRQSRKKREAKGYKDEYEMDFPSNEGALMTIGFLTFAVFLIKLVIKLVQALKYKYAYYGTTTTTTAATLILLKRKKREEFNEDTARITTYIDKLPYY